MGYDMELYVEKRDKGKWISAEVWGTQYVISTFRYPAEPLDTFYDSREYLLFSILGWGG